jgi:glycogen operon protein
MLLAGDEFGNSQGGNNNAYAQDNETGWLDWSGLERDPDFTGQLRELVRLRREQPMLRQTRYIHGRMPTDRGWVDIGWLRPDGRPMLDEDWNGGQRLTLLYSTHAGQKKASPVTEAVALFFNAAAEATDFVLPARLPPAWRARFSTSTETAAVDTRRWRVAGASLLLAISEANDTPA